MSQFLHRAAGPCIAVSAPRARWHGRWRRIRVECGPVGLSRRSRARLVLAALIAGLGLLTPACRRTVEPSSPRTVARSNPRSVAPSHPRSLRIIAPAAPGGGWDLTARAMQQALQRAGIVQTVSVENIPGAAGTIGLARFVGSEQGNGDVLMVSGLIMLGGTVMHGSPVTLRDVTPIARISGEYEVIVVPAGSPFQTLDDLVRALRERPEAVSWGGGSAGGSDQLLAGLLAEAVGVSAARINYVAFSGGGESLAAIVGGQVAVGVNGLSELEAQIRAGTVRALAVSSAERLEGLHVPTLREQGVDIEFENWRSVVGPPGLADDGRRRLEATVDAMVRSPEWQETLQRYRWLDRYLPADAFARFAEREEARVQQILDELGVGGTGRGIAGIGAYPVLVLTGLVVSAAALFIRRRVAARVSAISGSAPPGVWLVALAAAANLLVAEPLGFVIGSTVLFWLTARAFDPRYPLRDAVVAVAVSFGAYLLFARVLQLSLPPGLLGGWA
jgi:putative tricarboxylic transport membrane protein